MSARSVVRLPGHPFTPSPLHPFSRVARAAMGSLFEVYSFGEDAGQMEGAASEALDEIVRLDAQLSHYRDDSDIARINALAASEWVRVEPCLFALLERCAALSRATEGAFDITSGPLVKAWGFFRGEGRIPPEEELAGLRERVGMRHVRLDAARSAVRFTTPGVEIELGAIGKGYALDEAANVLRFYGTERAVIHGGQSTILALGAPPSISDFGFRISDLEPATTDHGRRTTDESGLVSGQPASVVGGPSSVVENPKSEIRNPQSAGWEFTLKDPRDHATPLHTVHLCDQAISTSGDYEQYFEVDGARYSHILDPRGGRPVQGRHSVWVVAPSAAESDALSTAFFVLGPERTRAFCRDRPELEIVMVEAVPDAEAIRVVRIGPAGQYGEEIR